MNDDKNKDLADTKKIDNSSKKVKPDMQAQLAKESYAAEEAKLRDYQEAFRQVQEATGVTDINKLVASFINCEHANFSLYTYANEQTNAIKALNADIENLKKEIVAAEKRNATQNDAMNAAEKNEIEKCTKQAAQYEKEAAKCTQRLTNVHAGLTAISKLINVKFTKHGSFIVLNLVVVRSVGKRVL